MIAKENLIQTLKDETELRKMNHKGRDELSMLLGPDFGAMKEYNQNNPHHHLDLLSHTIAVVTGIKVNNVDSREFIELRLAALFHDIGKPLTAMKKEDRLVFYGHAEKSSEITMPMLRKLGFQEETVQRIGFYIACHDTFISFRLPEEMPKRPNDYIKEIDQETVMRHITGIQTEKKKLGDYIPSISDFFYLLFLCIADAEAQAEYAILNGRIIDTRAKKARRMKNIQNIIKNALN